MDAELTQRIDTARMEARRLRHDAVEPEHLLAAVLDRHDVAEALRNRGLDPTELSEKLDARFTGRAVVGGYRDGSDVPFSATLQRVIARFGGRRPRWRPFAAKMTILDALLPEPSIAALVFDLRRGNDYRYLVERACALAIMSEHATCGVVHVFRVLLDLRSFVDTVVRAEGEVELLRAKVDELLAATPRAASPSEPPSVESAVRELISSAEKMARGSGAKAATIRQFCLVLARHHGSACFWGATGIESSAFVRAVHLPDVGTRSGRSLLR